jgi:hypothetical protein
MRSSVRPIATAAVLLFALAGLARAGSAVRCQTHHEPTLNRLQTLCDDGTRAVSTWSVALERWDTTITPPQGKACTGQLNPRTQQVDVRCR